MSVSNQKNLKSERNEKESKSRRGTEKTSKVDEQKKLLNPTGKKLLEKYRFHI